MGARRLVGAVGTWPGNRDEPVVNWNARALSDSEGRFVLDRVAPGHVMVFRPHYYGNGSFHRSHRQAFELAPGQTAEVAIGGAGRPVVGRLTRAAGLPYFDPEFVTGRLRLMLPEPEFPAGFDDWSQEKQRTWWYAFYKTEEGRKYYERIYASIVKVASDGSFRIDDVPEGHYRLVFEYETYSSEVVWVAKPASNKFAVESKPVSTKVAVCETDLDVPAGPDDKPTDLGTLTLTPREPDVVDR